MSQFKKFTLPSFTNRGYHLTPIEFKDVVAFTVKRLYYFDNLKSEDTTGEHCHREEQEVFIIARGSITAVVDYGQGKEEMRLADPGSAIYVPNYVWHGFKDASADCLVIALSSTNYRPDRSDYMEDYAEYLKIRDAQLS